MKLEALLFVLKDRILGSLDVENALQTALNECLDHLSYWSFSTSNGTRRSALWMFFKTMKLALNVPQGMK